MTPARSPVRSARSGSSPDRTAIRSYAALVPYLGVGALFGFVAIRSEIVSWFRIQEMFRFQSFHMYGVIASAVVVAALSVWLIKRFDVRTRSGDPITFQDKQPTWTRYLVGGTFFGLGWACIGACPGPMLALIGAGMPAFLIAVVGAIAGTWAYGALRDRLPHG